MEYTVSITQQGQLTIPSDVRKRLNITGQTRAVIEVQDNTLVVRPQDTFWSLAGRLKSTKTASDKQLHEARAAFAKNWPRKIAGK